MKKWDVIIIASVLIIAIFSGLLIFGAGEQGRNVVISKDNETVFEGDLSENKAIDLDGNSVVIKDGKVYVENADCANQICVNHAPISKKGETIVCLPNKVLVEIE